MTRALVVVGDGARNGAVVFRDWVSKTLRILQWRLFRSRDAKSPRGNLGCDLLVAHALGPKRLTMSGPKILRSELRGLWLGWQQR